MPRVASIALATAAWLLAAQASAFIPSSRLILTRLVHESGKGIYAIEQEVQFRTEADPIVLREKWIVENGDTMRLSVSGAKGSAEGWHFEALYRDGKRQWSDGGQLRTTAASAEFLEPILHFRSMASLLSWLTRARVLAPGFGRERHIYEHPSKDSAKDTKDPKEKAIPYLPEPGVRLARSGGVVTWALGEPAPAQGPLPSGLWIDQDAFQFRRMRFPSQAEVQADRHAAFSGGLRLPRERTVTWENNSVTIRVLSARSLPETASTLALLSASHFGSESQAFAYRLPEAAQVREFYSRFR